MLPSIWRLGEIVEGLLEIFLLDDKYLSAGKMVTQSYGEERRSQRKIAAASVKHLSVALCYSAKLCVIFLSLEGSSAEVQRS